MNRVQEFPLLMDVLVGGKYRVWWSEWRGDESAELIFTVPGQVRQKELTLPALVEYITKRYGVKETHPTLVQVAEGFRAKLAALRAEHEAKEAEQQARKERYQQLYAPFSGLSREHLMDEIHRLRQGEEGQLFRQVLAEKDAEIDRLEDEVAELEAKIETHDEIVDSLKDEKREAYRFAQQVLAGNEVLREENARLSKEHDLLSDHLADSIDRLDERGDESIYEEYDDSEVEVLVESINDPLSACGEYVETE